MAEPATNRSRVSHESRLLLLTIVVCVVVLLLLARMRFPGSTPPVTTAVQPLERLAAQASYDALAADIARVQSLIAPNVVALRTVRRGDPAPRRVLDVLDPAGASGVQHVAALRITSGMALAALSPDARIDAIVDTAPVTGTAAVAAVDPLRWVGRVRVPEAPARPLTTLSVSALRTPAYVAAVEGTAAGITLRPIFLGKGDRFTSPRWKRPLLPLGAIAVAPGALLFSLTGEFLGCVVVDNGALAIAGGDDVLEVFEELASGFPRVPATVGVAVQPLTPELASALGADSGVVIAEVDTRGPSSKVLRTADVIVAVDGRALADTDQFLFQLASRRVGERIPLTVIRQRESLQLSVVAGPTAPQQTAAIVSFERTPEGTRVREAGRGYRAPGLRPGDMVVAANGVADPSPTTLARLFSTAQPNTFIVVTIRRGNEQRVVAVRVEANAPAN